MGHTPRILFKKHLLLICATCSQSSIITGPDPLVFSQGWQILRSPWMVEDTAAIAILRWTKDESLFVPTQAVREFQVAPSEAFNRFLVLFR